jgi:hypothetical protein
MIPATAKYSARGPSTAMMLLVNTRNGSDVMAKIAGIESTAKTKSDVSIVIKVRASGVRANLPSIRTASRSPARSWVTGNNRLANAIIGLCSGSGETRARAILAPLTINSDPNMQRITAKSLYQSGTGKDHHRTHDQSTDNAPEQYSMLIQRRNTKVPKDDCDHKDIVHSKQLFDRKSGEEESCGHPPVRFVLGNIQPEPVVLI